MGGGPSSVGRDRLSRVGAEGGPHQGHSDLAYRTKRETRDWFQVNYLDKGWDVNMLHASPELVVWIVDAMMRCDFHDRNDFLNNGVMLVVQDVLRGVSSMTQERIDSSRSILKTRIIEELSKRLDFANQHAEIMQQTRGDVAATDESLV